MKKEDEEKEDEEHFEVSMSVFDDYIEGRRDKIDSKILDKLDKLLEEFISFEEIRIIRMSASRIIFYPKAERELREREKIDPELIHVRELREREKERLNKQKKEIEEK